MEGLGAGTPQDVPCRMTASLLCTGWVRGDRSGQGSRDEVAASEQASDISTLGEEPGWRKW